MTTALDPGKTTPTVPPHPGDKSAQDIRAALKRLKRTAPAPAPQAEEATR